jgi:flagellar motor switch protein FliG
VVEEFVETLDQVGLSFPDGLEGALSLLDGKLDERAARQLRALTRSDGQDDPWTRLELCDEEELIPILQAEAQVVGAVLLSKLSTDKAARLLMKLPAELAQALAIAISRTEDIAPESVARIGAALAEQVGAKPVRAFATSSSKRVGEILNASPSGLRQQLLEQLSDVDADFASGVREAIFTFDHISDRVEARDVPAIIREVATEDLLTIMACNRPDDMKVITFLLENMSKRAAESLREDAEARSAPAPDLHEAALNRVAAAVRAMADDGRIALRRTGTAR